LDPESRRVFFEAYVEFEPTKLLNDIGRFSDELMSLSEEQRNRLFVETVRSDSNNLDLEAVFDAMKEDFFTPEVMDVLVDRRADDILISLVIDSDIVVSDEQIHRLINRRLSAGSLRGDTVSNLERLLSERDIAVDEELFLDLLDSRLKSGSMANAGTDDFLRGIASRLEDGSRLLKLIAVAERMATTPSAALRHISCELLSQLRTTEDPEAAFTEIEGIFERNQLPLMGKVYKVFEALYPPDKLNNKASAERCSPTLRVESHRARMMTFYKDLLSVHIDSNNPSLRSYLETIRDGQGLADMVDADGLDSLSDEDRDRFDSFLGKMRRLYMTSLLGRIHGTGAAGVETDTSAGYAALRQGLGIVDGDSFSRRIAEMFLKPIGIGSIDGALERMELARVDADIRNRTWAEQGRSPRIKEGDLVKSFGGQYLQSILENGSVAKEFLGAISRSDFTPFDTDVSMVKNDDLASDLSGTLSKLPIFSYGDMAMLVSDRGQFQKTSKDSPRGELMRQALQREPKMELFPVTNDVGNPHFGIRTGFPSTEISALVASQSRGADRKSFDGQVADIIAHGLYIPVVDTAGSLLLSPEAFDDCRRRFFSGLEGRPFAYGESALESSPEYVSDLTEILEQKRLERPKVEAMNADIRKVIVGTLTENGVEVGVGYDELLTKAEIYDTGSSSRGTNVPGDVDFDYVVKLNAIDMDRIAEINRTLTEKLGGDGHVAHRTKQLRLLGALVGDGKADVDIGFVDKTEGSVGESHDAVSERLETIKETLGEEAWEKVVANIVLAKRMLKEGGAYKRFEDGGFGGIGVENWILSEGGSLLKAFESFDRAAFDGDRPKSLEEFRQEYKIIDPGINIKTGGHDNFVNLLTGEGYRRLAGTVRGYLERARGSSS